MAGADRAGRRGVGLPRTAPTARRAPDRPRAAVGDADGDPLITSDGVSRHEVDDLPRLLKDDDGVLWVDIPAGDPDAERVLGEVFAVPPEGGARLRPARRRAQGARLRRPRLRRPARPRAGAARAHPLRRDRPVRQRALPRHRARSGQRRRRSGRDAGRDRRRRRPGGRLPVRPDHRLRAVHGRGLGPDRRGCATTSAPARPRCGASSRRSPPARWATPSSSSTACSGCATGC